MSPEQWLMWLVIAVVLFLSGLMALAFFFVKTFGAYTDRLDIRDGRLEQVLESFDARTDAIMEMHNANKLLREHTLALIEEFRKHEQKNPKKEVA